LGKTSVDYKTALFFVDESALWKPPSHERPPGLAAETAAACLGEYTHVFVHPQTEKKTELSEQLRQGLKPIVIHSV